MAGEIPTNNDLNNLFDDDHGVDQDAGKKRAIANGAVFLDDENPDLDGETAYATASAFPPYRHEPTGPRLLG